MSKQRRLAHLFGSSKAPAARGSAEAAEEEEDETEEAEAESEVEDEEEGEPEPEVAEGEDGEDEDEEDGEENASAGLAAIAVMSSPEAKGREKLATSLAKDVARGALTKSGPSPCSRPRRAPGAGESHGRSRSQSGCGWRRGVDFRPETCRARPGSGRCRRAARQEAQRTPSLIPSAGGEPPACINHHEWRPIWPRSNISPAD